MSLTWVFLCLWAVVWAAKPVSRRSLNHQSVTVAISADGAVKPPSSKPYARKTNAASLSIDSHGGVNLLGAPPANDMVQADGSGGLDYTSDEHYEDGDGNATAALPEESSVFDAEHASRSEVAPPTGNQDVLPPPTATTAASAAAAAAAAEASAATVATEPVSVAPPSAAAGAAAPLQLDVDTFEMRLSKAQAKLHLEKSAWNEFAEDDELVKDAAHKIIDNVGTDFTVAAGFENVAVLTTKCMGVGGTLDPEHVWAAKAWRAHGIQAYFAEGEADCPPAFDLATYTQYGELAANLAQKGITKIIMEDHQMIINTMDAFGGPKTYDSFFANHGEAVYALTCSLAGHVAPRDTRVKRLMTSASIHVNEACVETGSSGQFCDTQVHEQLKDYLGRDPFGIVQ